MDALDQKLIKLLLKDARASVSKLAEQLHLSRPTVRERMLRLEECGIIEKYTVRLSKEIDAYPIHFYSLVAKNGPVQEDFINRLLAYDGVFSVSMVTGPYHYLIYAGAKSAEDMNERIEEWLKYGTVMTLIELRQESNEQDV